MTNPQALTKKMNTMQPPLGEQALNKRQIQGINKEISIGGKFFCWHDYTCLWEKVPKKHLLDWGYIHLCIKCGKKKIFSNPLLEPID